MKSYRLAAAARRDVQRICEYIGKDSPNAARRVANALTDKFEFLGRNPEAGKHREDVRLGYRSFPVFEYLIFYRIEFSGVRIMRVIHGRRDLPRLLN